MRMLGRSVTAAVSVHSAAMVNAWAPWVTRVYLGWEFCPNLFPSRVRLLEMAWAAWQSGVEATVATPFLPESSYDHIATTVRSLADRWSSWTGGRLELVVNDIGLLSELRTAANVELVAGRMLNKQRRDPRVAEVSETLPPEFAQYLRSSSSSSSLFLKWLGCVGIKRAEFDNSPAGFVPVDSSIARTLHFPFAYVASGRNCAWAAAAGENAGNYDVPCKQECQVGPAFLKTPGLRFTLHSFGNTLFFRHDDLHPAIDLLAPDRLVYTPDLPIHRLE